MCKELHGICDYIFELPCAMGLEVTNGDDFVHDGSRDYFFGSQLPQLFPIIDMTMGLSDAVGLPIQEMTLNMSIHKDNQGALVLVKKLPSEFTPQSNYYADKTHWFREEIRKRCIQVVKISTVE